MLEPSTSVVTDLHIVININFTRGQFWPLGIVVPCICLCVPVCVCNCVCINLELVCTITHHPFKLGSPNLDDKCITHWLRFPSFLGAIDVNLQGQIELHKSKFTPFWACPWHLFLRVQLTIFEHWFRQWLGTIQATSHYLNQCWPNSPTHIYSSRGGWINYILIWHLFVSWGLINILADPMFPSPSYRGH